MEQKNFKFDIHTSVFEKAGAPEGREQRIGGIVSTDSPDKQGETVLQEGLDFSSFLSSGWLNDNHSKVTTDIVGYPEIVQKFQRGQALPDGQIAKANGTWIEAYLLKTRKAQDIWELGQALQKTNRRLGFSVEGKVVKRDGPKTIFVKGEEGEGQWVGRVVAKAEVRNVAITNAPVQQDSRLELLIKSLVEEEEEAEKALGMGDAPANVKPQGVKTGMGAGRVLTPQHLEGKEDKVKLQKIPNVSKSLTEFEALEFIKSKIPAITAGQALELISLTKYLKLKNKL